MKRSFFAIVFFLFIFYPELFFVRAAPLTGDHLEQHYPWAFLLSHSLKQFKLPLWSLWTQCGFPIAAESQIAIFYIPNLLLYLFLPFQAAYSYMNIVHWVIAAWGTFLYAKQMKMSRISSLVAAFLFIFGSAYGGAYYNMTSLKTICWFPLALFFLERFLEKPKGRYFLGLAFLISQSVVAGYLQMAVLTWFIFGLYALFRIFIFSEKPLARAKKWLKLGAVGCVVITALVLTLPQIYLTFRLAVLSNRIGLEEGYSYVGSASPSVLSTLFNPHLWPLVKGNLYAGLFSLFLIFVGFAAAESRKSKIFRIWSLMTLLAFLLALGQWSPLYVALIKITKFYSFRIPAKFLGFCGFGLAMLSAVGFEILWRGKTTQKVVKKAFYAFSILAGTFVGVTILAKIFLTAGKDAALKLGDFFVTRFVYAKPGHPHSLETYHKVLENYPAEVLKFLSFGKPENIWTGVMLAFCIVLLVIFIKQKTIGKSLLIAGLVFLFVDLYSASYIGMKPNFAFYETALAPSPILNALGEEKENGRLGRVYGFRSSDQPPPFISGRYMLEGIESIGAYSPFVPRRYFESIGLLGGINDSNYQNFPTLDFVRQRLPLLSFLNVSHVLSSEAIEHDDLTLIKQYGPLGSFLYENKGIHALAYFLGNLEIVPTWNALHEKLMAPHFDPRKNLLLESEEIKKIGLFDQKNTEPSATIQLQNRQEDFEEWEIETDRAGFLVISEILLPGWKVTINGEPAPILKADGLFRAVRINGRGRYKIQFRYQPFSVN